MGTTARGSVLNAKRRFIVAEENLLGSSHVGTLKKFCAPNNTRCAAPRVLSHSVVATPAQERAVNVPVLVPSWTTSTAKVTASEPYFVVMFAVAAAPVSAPRVTPRVSSIADTALVAPTQTRKINTNAENAPSHIARVNASGSVFTKSALCGATNLVIATYAMNVVLS